MTISRKQLLIAAGLFLTASTAFASAPLQTGFYVGGNSGASFITNQATGHIGLRIDTERDESRNVGDDVHALYKEESSIRGYNGGAFVGWNFYCNEDWFHGVELSGDFFSNRGQYAFDLAYVREVSNVDIDVRAANFKDVYDLEFALNLAFKPGAKINDSTVLFGIIGASWARFDSEIERIRHRDSNYVRPSLFPGALAVAHQDEDGDNRGRHHHNDNDHEEDLWGFVLGAGVSTQITHYLSAFASYQYTYYGTVDLDNERSRQRSGDSDDNSRVHVRVSDRHSIVDNSTAKVGIAFNF